MKQIQGDRFDDTRTRCYGLVQAAQMQYSAFRYELYILNAILLKLFTQCGAVQSRQWAQRNGHEQNWKAWGNFLVVLSAL